MEGGFFGGLHGMLLGVGELVYRALAASCPPLPIISTS